MEDTMKKTITCIALAGIISIPAFGKDATVATVDGVAIKRSQVDAFINSLPQQYDSLKGKKEFREKITKFLVEQQVLYNEAKEKKIPERKDVKEAIENAKRQIIVNALIKDYLSKRKITVSDKEIKDYYEANKDRFKNLKGKVVPLETVKPYIKQQLLAQKQKEAINSYIESLKKKHKVSYSE